MEKHARYNDALRRLARQIAVSGDDPSTDRSMEQMHTLVAEELAASREDMAVIACGPGCPRCCTLNVSVLEPEARVIAHRLSLLPPEQQQEFGERVRDKARTVRWMEDRERVWRGISCPFLDESGSCAFYEVRPLLCRSVTSRDRDQCHAALASLGETDEVAVEVDLLTKYLWEEAFTTLAGELERAGKTGRSMEMCAAVAEELGKPGR